MGRRTVKNFKNKIKSGGGDVTFKDSSESMSVYPALSPSLIKDESCHTQI